MLAYDTLQPDTNGMATADVVDSYNGAPERYEWKLVGSRKPWCPTTATPCTEGHPLRSDPQDQVRQRTCCAELHRTWVVEATLRKGFAHPYAKRRFYIDEDSWQILAVDLYDKDGQLIGLQESHPISY